MARLITRARRSHEQCHSSKAAEGDELQLPQTAATVQPVFPQLKFRTLCTKRKECGTRPHLGQASAEAACGIIAPAVMSMEKHHESQKSAPPLKTKNMLRQQLPHAQKPSMGHPKRQRQQPRPPAGPVPGAPSATPPPSPLPPPKKPGVPGL